MNSDRKADYYVGLDMGTGSLGVAVTDPQYHLLKVKGKDFWFVREYETAHPQLERRTHRISKRRLQRHQVRIGLIRSYFADDVLEHDPLFYIRQDNSKYYREDKDSRLLTKDSLFAEPNYGDKEYYKEYPTVFHLRQALLKDEISSEERYSRLLYLAIINMFEYRGHFLLNTDSGDVNFEMVKDAGETVMNYLYDSMEEAIKIHLSEIEILMIESTAVSLTAALLCELTKKKIKVIFCDEKRNPSSELIGYYGAHDTSLKVRNQIAWSEEIKKHVWTEIVAEKIRKQALHLNYWNRGEAEQLYEYINEIEFGDATNREGHAAKVYFNALFGMDFTRSAENVTNAALNYGYSLLLSTFNRCVVANGYITQLGLFHDNVFNQFNLACDLMEPFRPIVDMKVKKMGFSFFEKEQKYEMISLLKEEVIIGNRNEYLTNAIKIYTKSVFDALNDNDVSQIKFYRTNEL